MHLHVRLGKLTNDMCICKPTNMCQTLIDCQLVLPPAHYLDKVQLTCMRSVAATSKIPDNQQHMGA